MTQDIQCLMGIPSVGKGLQLLSRPLPLNPTVLSRRDSVYAGDATLPTNPFSSSVYNRFLTYSLVLSMGRICAANKKTIVENPTRASLD
jgi:hypothetical protein